MSARLVGRQPGCLQDRADALEARLLEPVGSEHQHLVGERPRGIGGGNVPKEQYNSEVYKAICSHFATCGIAKSADTCFKYYQTLLGAYALVGTSFYDKAIELGKIKYDGAAAARCLSGYSNSACSLSALIVPAADCLSVYVGQVPVGSACGDGQCVPSAFCSSEVDAKCPGTCKARVEAGGTATSLAECVYGLVVISGTCSQPLQEGSSCSTPGPFGSCAPAMPCAIGIRCFVDDALWSDDNSKGILRLIIATGIGEEAAARITYLEAAPRGRAPAESIRIEALAEFIGWKDLRTLKN